MSVYQIIARHPLANMDSKNDDIDGVFWVQAMSETDVSSLLTGKNHLKLSKTDLEDGCPGQDAKLPDDLSAVQEWIKNPRYEDGTNSADYNTIKG